MTRAGRFVKVHIVDIGGMDTSVEVLGFRGSDARCRIVDGHYDTWLRAFVPGADHGRDVLVPADTLGSSYPKRIG